MSIFERWGVAPIINATGTVTRLGGAPMPEAVLDAWREASQSAVALDQLQSAASQQLSIATGTEAGIVTCGSAAALTLGTAAILAGLDLARMEHLPDTRQMPNEFVVAREQRSGYDHAVRAAGAVLVEVGFNEIVAGAGVRRTEVWEYEAAFGPQTAGVLYVLGRESAPPLHDVVQAAHSRNLPVLVDAAGELPPRASLSAIAASGADLIGFSGGKAIRGPQATGILCGRRTLVASALLQMLDMDDHAQLWDPPELLRLPELDGRLPRHGIGRSMKVAKEGIAALLTAVELFASGAYDDQRDAMLQRLDAMRQQIIDLPMQCRIHNPEDGERMPLLEIELQAESPLDAYQLCRRLRRATPPIYVGHGQLDQRRLIINPLGFDDRQATVIVQQIREILLSSGCA